MTKPKIAILDSGIADCYQKNVGIINRAHDNIDDNGHGTMCYSIIHAMAPDSIIYISKILDRNLQGSSNKLVQELEGLVDTDIDIINLSLSTNNFSYKHRIDSVCKKLYEQGKIIVSAQNNVPNVKSYPCLSPYVIGVNGGIFESNYEYTYQASKRVQAVANKVPYLAKGVDNKYHFFGGNSKATACMAGIISNYWTMISNLSQKERAKMLNDKAVNISEHKLSIDKIDNCMRSRIELFVEKEFSTNIEQNSNMIKEREVCDSLKNFEIMFQVKLNFENISLLTILDRKKLCNLFAETVSKESD